MIRTRGVDMGILNQEPGTNHTLTVGYGSDSEMNALVPEPIPLFPK